MLCFSSDTSSLRKVDGLRSFAVCAAVLGKKMCISKIPALDSKTLPGIVLIALSYIMFHSSCKTTHVIELQHQTGSDSF